MAKKPTPDQPAASAPIAALAAAGGSYLADEALGAVQQEGPAEAPPRPRRGFGNPTQSAGAPDAATPAGTPDISKE